MTWAKCLRQEGKLAVDALAYLRESKVKAWDVVAQHWDFFFADLQDDSPAEAFTKAEARLPS
jgi:hypothetical protein